VLYRIWWTPECWDRVTVFCLWVLEWSYEDGVWFQRILVNNLDAVSCFYTDAGLKFFYYVQMWTFSCGAKDIHGIVNRIYITFIFRQVFWETELHLLLRNARKCSSYRFQKFFPFWTFCFFCIPHKLVDKQMNISVHCHDNGFLLLSSFPIKLLVLSAIFKLVCLNNLIMNCLCLGTCEFYMLCCWISFLFRGFCFHVIRFTVSRGHEYEVEHFQLRKYFCIF
jgi:hypothetical protein